MTSLEGAPSGAVARLLPFCTKEVVAASRRERASLVPILGMFVGTLNGRVRFRSLHPKLGSVRG